MIAGLARRRRFCTWCGAVVVAEEEASCPACGRTSLTRDGEAWRRIRTRTENEETEHERQAPIV